MGILCNRRQQNFNNFVDRVNNGIAEGVQPDSMVYNSIIEVNDKMVGFDLMNRRKSPLNEGFTGNPCDSDLLF